jgi:uncharacterized protein YdaU (DUF1376 family)
METPWIAFYPGDYINKTRSLTVVQHGIYTLLLWEYYVNGPLLAKATGLLNVCQCRSQSDEADMMLVLGKFFRLEGGYYRNDRADEEIERRVNIRQQRKEFGKQGGLAKARRLQELKLKQKATQSQSHIKPEVVEGLNSENTKNKILEGGGFVENRPPENMPALNYAIKIVDDLGMTGTMANKIVVEAAVKALIKSGMSGVAAYEFLVAQAKDAIDNGIAIDKFWFEDSKWRNGNGRANSKAAQRFINNRKAILDGFGISEGAGDVFPDVRSGPDAGGIKNLATNLRLGKGRKD